MSNTVEHKRVSRGRDFRKTSPILLSAWFVITAALVMSAASNAAQPAGFEVDACSGGDLQTVIQTLPEYLLNSLSVTKKNTYPQNSGDNFGCPRDSAQTVLGHAQVVAQDFHQFQFGFPTETIVFDLANGQIVLQGKGSFLVNKGCDAGVIPVVGATGPYVGRFSVARFSQISGTTEVCRVVFSNR